MHFKEMKPLKTKAKWEKVLNQEPWENEEHWEQNKRTATDGKRREEKVGSVRYKHPIQFSPGQTCIL